MPTLGDRFTASFAKVSAVTGDQMTLSGGQPIPCVVGEDGIIRAPSQDPGRTSVATSARITAKLSDLGGHPPAALLALQLKHGGQTYDLAVSDDEDMEIKGGGVLCEFTATNA